MGYHLEVLQQLSARGYLPSVKVRLGLWLSRCSEAWANDLLMLLHRPSLLFEVRNLVHVPVLGLGLGPIEIATALSVPEDVFDAAVEWYLVGSALRCGRCA